MLVVGQYRLSIPTTILLYAVALEQMAAEQQSDKMVSDMEVCMKHRSVTKSFHTEVAAPINIGICRQ